MSRRYDSRTTTYSREGRLMQVEYAMNAIDNAAAAVGILATDGIVLATQKAVTSKLLAPSKTSDKLFTLDSHVMCAIAGLTSDANILLSQARLTLQRHFYTYQEPQPIEQLVEAVCDTKQSYTQFGGLRPFGVSFLFAGWDKHQGFQLYHSDPSGNYSGWKATAIGNNHAQAESILKSDYKEDQNVEQCLKLAVSVLGKAMDTAIPTAEKVEFATVTRVNGKVVKKILSSEEVTALLKTVEAEKAAAGDK